MSIFGTYYTVNLLREAKWPRKQGLLKKEVYDIFIVDRTIESMVDWAASIGAGNPLVALKIIAYVYQDRDWKTDEAPNLPMYVEGMQNSYQERGLDPSITAPSNLNKPFQFENHFKSPLPANAFGNKDTKNILETSFIAGLIYGLSHPKAYESWYEHNLKEHHKNKDIYKDMNLDLDELPDLKENYANSIEIIELYENEMDITFPPIPDELKKQAWQIRKH
jgi:hypothetical protein